MTNSRKRLTSIKRAIADATSAELKGEISAEETIARIAVATLVGSEDILGGGNSLRERLAAAQQKLLKKMLNELAELESQGRRREACKIVARRHCDVSDPIAVENLARLLRRVRPRRQA
jgi:hypothetical protein